MTRTDWGGVAWTEHLQLHSCLRVGREWIVTIVSGVFQARRRRVLESFVDLRLFACEAHVSRADLAVTSFGFSCALLGFYDTDQVVLLSILGR